MGHKQQARAPTLDAAGVPVVKRRHHRLAGAGGRHQEVSGSSVGALGGQLLQHFQLVGLWLKVEKADRGRGLAAKRLTTQRRRQCLSVFNVVRVVALKLAVRPQRLEVGFGACK